MAPAGSLLLLFRVHTHRENVIEIYFFQGQGIVREFCDVAGKIEILQRCQLVNSTFQPGEARIFGPDVSCLLNSSNSWLQYCQGNLNLCLGRGWLGGAKVSCILHHWGILLMARPAILIAGKGRGGMFLFLLFLRLHSCSSFFPVPLFHLLYYLFYLISPFLFSPSRVDVSLNPNTVKNMSAKCRENVGEFWSL